MEDDQLLNRINFAKKSFGKKCKKYAGSITVEFIRQAFRDQGIECSERDVFIRGLPIEFDLLIPKPGVIPENKLLYQAQDVVIALEIKNSGSFGESTIAGIKRNYELLKEINPGIRCAYVTLTERRSYKWLVKEENIGFPAYTLFWYNGSAKNSQNESSGDWTRLLKDIKYYLTDV